MFYSMLFNTFRLDDVGYNKIGKYNIDTCYTFDCGYETAIWTNKEKIIIVERYEYRFLAEKGHKKWCEFCKTNPTKAYSVQFEEFINFDNKKNKKQKLYSLKDFKKEDVAYNTAIAEIKDKKLFDEFGNLIKEYNGENNGKSKYKN